MRITTAVLKKQVMDSIGEETFSVDTFNKALAKYKRWMRAAFGAVDWSENTPEGHASTLVTYYNETAADSSGRKTFNRKTA